jgi:crotonobetainyl-CoA:carnitine CoA-transferase CaiB-like acyl-CoA transferase
MPGPLNGVRVLDLTGVVSGPFATMFLADQGADVLKIEPIGGDITRRSRANIDKAGEFSALFISSNRGKRSLSIDVKSRVGREVLARLVAQADVLVQNFRPGTVERLGLGADQLRERHPRLIYVSISGVGDTGPYVKKRVYDPIIQGLSGFADIQSQPVTNRPADDPYHRLRQDHRRLHRAGSVVGALCPREDRQRRPYPGCDA